MMHTKCIVVCGACLAMALGIARAQNPAAGQQVDSAARLRQVQSTFPAGTNAVPEFYEGETSDVGPQSVLQVRRHRTWFQAFADEQFFYTDNVFLANHHAQGASVLISTVQAALAPSPFEVADGFLSPRLGYQQQWFTYGLADSETVRVYPSLKKVDLNQFDFNAATVFSDIGWRWQNWTFTIGGDYRRLLTSDDYSEFYHEFVPRWGVRRDVPLSESVSLSLGYEGDYRFTYTIPPAVVTPTSPNYPDTFNDRTDQSLVLVGNWQMCPRAILQPFYRLQYSHFTQIDRDDWLNSFGLTLYCPITKCISLRTFVTYDIMNTDGFYVQNFSKLDAGAGLNLTVSF
ncbi:MAG TPA: hypothetical protein VNN22_18100 [Verrucomicrobiae bacterium]|nr:hypothetical protein [Verrucomicrobiae bacterium]